MSSRSRSGRHRTSQKVTKLSQSNNVMLFKLIDPIGQSLLFVLFLYCIDSEKHFSYRMVLYILVGWQLVSVFINMFFGALKLLKNERILYLVVMLAYMVFFYFFERSVKENFIALDHGASPSIPMNRVILYGHNACYRFLVQHYLLPRDTHTAGGRGEQGPIIAAAVDISFCSITFAKNFTSNMSLLIVGTMAFDALETPFDKVDRIIGGSATYAAWAASNFVKPIKQISIVGGDFPQEEIKALEERGVAFEGVEVVKDGKSFFWSGRYHLDMNTRDTLVTELNVLAQFDPKVPESYQGAEFVMLGNLAPAVQISVLNQLSKRPKLIIMDTMNFWMDNTMEDLSKVLGMVDLLMVNDSEARQLSGEHSLVKAARKIQAMGPKYLVIKKGEHGALLFYENKIFSAPALPLEDVFDPTGAGDTFAGGFIGYLARINDTSFESMKAGIIVGSAMASYCVEKFGPERLKELTGDDIDKRVSEFIELANFEVR